MDMYLAIIRVMQNIGDFDGALRMLKKFLAVQEKKLGVVHRSTATTTWNIGKFLEARGDLDTALVMFRKCLETRKKLYGENHSTTIRTKKHIDRWLGFIYSAMNTVYIVSRGGSRICGWGEEGLGLWWVGS